MKISGVMIGSENTKPLGDFYTKIFGKPGWQQDDWYGFDIGGGSLMIGPHSEVKGKSNEPARIMIVVLSDDVRKDFSQLKDLGAEVVAEPYQPNDKEMPDIWLATVADPDGNYLQLTTPWGDK
jgi:predicted enzyme related to lactoylglutathione lyase